MKSEKLSLSRQIMDAREARLMIGRASVALGVNGWSAAEIERVQAGLHAIGVTLEWLEKNEALIKERLTK